MSGELSEDELWELLGYVKGGDHRYDVFCHLARRGVATPSEVAEDTGKSPQRVYDAQTELEERDLIELKVPDDQKKGRIRTLTGRGRQVWQFMIEHGVEDEQVRGR